MLIITARPNPTVAICKDIAKEIIKFQNKLSQFPKQKKSSKWLPLKPDKYVALKPHRRSFHFNAADEQMVINGRPRKQTWTGFPQCDSRTKFILEDKGITIS